jgi:hypothetical protein
VDEFHRDRYLYQFSNSFSQFEQNPTIKPDFSDEEFLFPKQILKKIVN